MQLSHRGSLPRPYFDHFCALVQDYNGPAMAEDQVRLFPPLPRPGRVVADVAVEDGHISAVGPNLTDAEWIHSDGSYDAIVKQVTTGVTKEELAAARDRALRDHKARNAGPRLEPGRVAHAVEILERLHGGGILGEGGSILQ